MSRPLGAHQAAPRDRALHLTRRLLVGALILAVVLALYVFVLTRGAIL